MAAAAENGLVGMANGKLSPPRFPVAMIGSSGGVVAQSYGFETSEEDLEFEEKVEELMRMDSAVIKEEIKNFLGNRRISQAVVAQVTGISQSRISHWLVQQGSDLSDQKKRAFYRWYLLEKTNPGATLAMRPAPMAMDEMVEWHHTPPSFGSMPGGSRLRRGSRFTWRKECLSVMESYFGDNQYPDEAKREEIASACNAVIPEAREEAVLIWRGSSHLGEPRHGRGEPGGHSNSDEVDGNDFPEQGSEVSVFDKRAANRAFGLSRIDLSLTHTGPILFSPAGWLPGRALGRGGMNPPVTAHPLRSRTRSAWAVEMAAVNHTILALANQASDGGAGASTGNDIKTETMEDE
ncbi:unnamed protein product [Boreogadus saida]